MIIFTQKHFRLSRVGMRRSLIFSFGNTSLKHFLGRHVVCTHNVGITTFTKKKFGHINPFSQKIFINMRKRDQQNIDTSRLLSEAIIIFKCVHVRAEYITLGPLSFIY